jgi:hypothetical protein
VLEFEADTGRLDARGLSAARDSARPSARPSFKVAHSSTFRFDVSTFCGTRWVFSVTTPAQLQLSVGVTRDAYLLEIEGPLTQGSRQGRAPSGSVGEVTEKDRSDWSCGIRYQNFDTRSDTEFKLGSGGVEGPAVIAYTRPPFGLT